MIYVNQYTPMPNTDLTRTIIMQARIESPTHSTLDGVAYTIINRKVNFRDLTPVNVSSCGAWSRENIIFDQARYLNYLNDKKRSLDETLATIRNEATLSRAQDQTKNLLLLIMGLAQSVAKQGTYPDSSSHLTIERLKILIESKRESQTDKKQDPIIYFEDIMEIEAKVCRHAAIESAFLTSYFIQEACKSSDICRDTFADITIHNFRDNISLPDGRRGGHTWTLVKSKNNNIFYILDPTWGNILDLNNPNDRDIASKKYGTQVLNNMYKSYGEPRTIVEARRKNETAIKSTLIKEQGSRIHLIESETKTREILKAAEIKSIEDASRAEAIKKPEKLQTLY